MKAKLCPICGGKPVFIHYAIPKKVCPDAWEETETGFEPLMTYKRIECENCKATTMYWNQCDELIQVWNERKIIEFITQEPIQEVADN